MLPWWKNFKHEQDIKRTLLNFYHEMEQNLESVYVMQQRGVLEKFRLESWQQLQDRQDIPLPAETIDCVKELEVYNRLMTDYKNFEQWYAAELERKTPDNARTLHHKREAVAQKFQGMLAVVKPAKEILEAHLAARKILKKK